MAHTDHSGIPAQVDRQAQLENSIIDGYLTERGFSPAQARSSNDPKVMAIVAEATKFASGQLATVQCRAHLVHDLHGTHGVSKA